MKNVFKAIAATGLLVFAIGCFAGIVAKMVSGDFDVTGLAIGLFNSSSLLAMIVR